MSIKIIKNRIKVIKNTEKITYAMQMVSRSKMAKLQDHLKNSTPYIKMLRTVLEHILSGHLIYQHAFLDKRIIKNVSFIIIGSDRGLCGGINTQLFKKTMQKIQRYKDIGIGIKVTTLGSKAKEFFSRMKDIEMVDGYGKFDDFKQDAEVKNIVNLVVNEFLEGKIDVLYIAYNKFVNSMNQQAVIDKLLPITAQEYNVQVKNWDYIYEPSPKYLIDSFMLRYMQSIVYSKLIENMLCIEAARMMAMRTATNNALGLIKELTLLYNKERQAIITKEISEIISGAEAIS